MNDTSPFVIQFPSLDDFITDFALSGADVARVWPGQFSTGGNPGVSYHVIMVQAIDLAQHTILQSALMFGSYQTIHGQPFGPTEETCAKIVQGSHEQALADVQSYLVSKLPDVILRKGHIHTGLNGPQISRTPWDGFDPIYEELRRARKRE